VLTPQQGLGFFAAGEEASDVQDKQLSDHMYAETHSDYTTSLQLLYAKLDLTLYVWTDLRQSQLTDFGAFVSSPRYASDPAQYAFAFAQLRPSMSIGTTFESLKYSANRIRSGVWLNLLDPSLYFAGMDVVNYIATGSRGTHLPELQIGTVALLPSAHFTITPIGFERSVNIRLASSQIMSDVEFRQTEVPDGRRLGALGVNVRSGEPTWLSPGMWVDVWAQPSHGNGYRVELGTARSVAVGQHVTVGTLRIGYKTQGYLLGAPMRQGIIGRVNVELRF
jgi:hypothetical protein